MIENGINPGDILVTDGVDKLQDGSAVTYRLGRPAAVVASTQPRPRRFDNPSCKPRQFRSAGREVW